MELFKLEHQKLWRQKSVKICVFLCLTYILVIGDILSYQWNSFGSYNTVGVLGLNNNFDGYQWIKRKQDHGRTFGGLLTDETLQQMVRDYQEREVSGLDVYIEYTDVHTINTWLLTLYPELVQSDQLYPNMLISYVDPDQLTGFYERRAVAVRTFLTANSQTGQEAAYLLQMDEQIKEPFSYEWTDGWGLRLGSGVSDLGVVMALVLAIVLSGLFAGERYHNTYRLMLTTKDGWQKAARVKILTGLVFTAELFGLILVGDLGLQLLYMGTSGWYMPIQTIKLIAIAPMNMLQAEIYEYVFALLGALGYAGVVMCISAASGSNVMALILSLSAVYGVRILSGAGYIPLVIQKMLELMPLVGSSADIFRTNTYHIFGWYIWSPYLLITVPILIGMGCLPFAVKGWARQMKV